MVPGSMGFHGIQACIGAHPRQDRHAGSLGGGCAHQDHHDGCVARDSVDAEPLHRSFVHGFTGKVHGTNEHSVQLVMAQRAYAAMPRHRTRQVLR